ncbi:CRISPR-associated protein Cas1 [Berryella intestinalis]|uniref:CRISPR-associated endonuclease Cas1 n=1 Tax=Berryella intestinalis TaxID=1531429 RepID=A0A0A8B8C7_9ACTN|nr:type I-C CRISPR-associated endonuclease Cas1c [Berryella intestinalis]AJC11387.1 CRISPR-associated protein Cas1 [Berryella intestinalis]
MRRLLNTLYILTEDAYLALDGDNVVAKQGGAELGRVPLHTLEGIQVFSYAGASPALMGACAAKGIAMGFYDRHGRFLADVQGEFVGNVLLRKAQYESAFDEERCLAIARNFILGKVFNCKWILERALRDHGLRIDASSVKEASSRLSASLTEIRSCRSLESLRGIEGDAAAVYFGVFDELILREKETFYFRGRTRRPPLDAVNAMLSLFYTVLARDCSAALRGVGLDPYMGFLHVERPGRRSLALDCMEELRPVLVDRFVLSAVNNRVVNSSHFQMRETGEVGLNSEGRRVLFDAWQNKKRESMTHPFVKEKIPWGLVPFVQAQLFGKFLRGDLDQYPPVFWK